MTQSEVWLFGNEDLIEDSLPPKLKPLLIKEFPKVDFIIQDPLDEWPQREKLIIIDTVKGLDKVQVFTSLADFTAGPLVTMHDFDLKTELEFRAKLGALPPFVIIGLPFGLTETEAMEKLKIFLPQYLK